MACNVTCNSKGNIISVKRSRPTENLGEIYYRALQSMSSVRKPSHWTWRAVGAYETVSYTLRHGVERAIKEMEG